MTTSWNVLIFGILSDATQVKEMKGALADMRAALTSSRYKIGVQLVSDSGGIRYWITSEDKNAWEPVTPDSTDTSDPACLTAFLEAAEAKLGKARTALIVYSHGSGLDTLVKYFRERNRWPPTSAFKGVPFRLGPRPGTTDKFLSNPDLRKAIEAGPHGHVDVVAINACWMGTLEIVHELRTVCRVAVTSQVFALAWDYGDLIAQLCAHGASDSIAFGSLIVKRVRHGILHDGRDDVVSACRTDRLDAFAAEFNAYARAVSPLLKTSWSSITKAIGALHRPDDPTQADVASVLKRLGRGNARVKAAARRALGLYKELVFAFAKNHTHRHLTGLNVLCPPDGHYDILQAYGGLDVADLDDWELLLADLSVHLTPGD